MAFEEEHVIHEHAVHAAAVGDDQPVALVGLERPDVVEGRGLGAALDGDQLEERREQRRHAAEGVAVGRDQERCLRRSADLGAKLAGRQARTQLRQVMLGVAAAPRADDAQLGADLLEKDAAVRRQTCTHPCGAVG